MMRQKFAKKITTIIICNFFFCLVTLSQPSIAIELKPYQLTYQGTWNNLPVFGKASRELILTEDNQFKLSQNASALIGSFKETSFFNWQNNSPLSQSYTNQRSGFGKKRFNNITIDWEKHQIQATENQKQRNITFEGTVYDSLTYQTQLRYDLSLLNDLGKTTQFSYQIAEKRKLRTYEFQLIGQEKLETPLGIFNTVKIAKIRADNNKRKTYIWLATDWDFLPIQIAQSEKNGSDYELIIKSGKLGEKPISGQDTKIFATK